MSWPLYRLLLIVSLIPLALAALALRNVPVPPEPVQPIAVSGSSVVAQSRQFIASRGNHNCCAPGTPGELAAARWMARKLRPFDPTPETVQFAANLAWQANPVAMENVIAYKPGAQPGVIVVIAHRDGRSAETAAGSAILVELARQLDQLPLQRGVALVSTDGGTTGGQGAADFASHWPEAGQIATAIVIASVGSAADGRIQLLLRPAVPRGTSPTAVATVREQLQRTTQANPAMPGAYDQLSGYAVPYAAYEQGELLHGGVPALTVSDGGPLDGPPYSAAGLDSARLGRIGSAVATAVMQLDVAPTIEPGGDPVLFLGGRVTRGWLVQLALGALLLPVLACILHLIAGLRRRKVPLAPGMRALAWRTSAWLVALVTLWVLTVMPGRLMPRVADVPLPGRTGVTSLGLVITLAVPLLWWRFVSRPRLVRVAPVSGTDRTGGLASGLAGAMFATLLLTAVNPFTLVLVLPAVHAWLWLAHAARISRRTMLAVWAVGLIGPLALVIELWHGQGVGSQTPRSLVAMTASGYLTPAIPICLALFTAAAMQLLSLVTGRYSPPHPPAL